MDKPKTQLSYAAIVTALQQICAEKRTGALIILSAFSSVTRIHVTNGEIVALIMQEKKGQEVVPLLAHIKATRMDFFAGLPCSLKTPLPATSTLLEELAAQTPPPSMLTAPVPASPPSGRLLGATAQALLGKTLAEYIGPMAMIVSKKILATPQDAEGAVQALARSIPAAEDARRFVAEMRAKLAA